MSGIYDNHGIRFEYPDDWEAGESDGDSPAIVTVQSPDGLAFAIVTSDADRPDPASMADEAILVMRAEYSDLEVTPSIDTINGQPASGFELEFIALNMVNSCTIHVYRTPRRSIMLFRQWAEIATDESEEALRTMGLTLEETDS